MTTQLSNERFQDPDVIMLYTPNTEQFRGVTVYLEGDAGDEWVYASGFPAMPYAKMDGYIARMVAKRGYSLIEMRAMNDSNAADLTVFPAYTLFKSYISTEQALAVVKYVHNEIVKNNEQATWQTR